MKESARNPIKILSEVQELSKILSSSLEEEVFFPSLASFFNGLIKADRIQIYKIMEDFSANLIYDDGLYRKNGIRLAGGEGLMGYVIKNKRSYFSNNVKKDPLLKKEDKNIFCELCVPIIVEGVIIGTIHFQGMADSLIKYSQRDINLALQVFFGIKEPLKNMKMYLAAKHLNELLMEKLRTKHKESISTKKTIKILDFYKAKEQDIIGKSMAVRKLLFLSDKIAATDIPLLIQGENGTGKEAVACHIHGNSARKNQAFITLDCSSMSKECLDRELFGEEESVSFEGNNFKMGLIEAADKGTLVLKNIFEMPFLIQKKLVDFLKEKTALRVGGKIAYKSDVRIIVTSKIVQERLENNKIREALLFYFNTIVINMTSLRDRDGDVLGLADYFLNGKNSCTEKKILSNEVKEILQTYSWPGNIRELKNVIGRVKFTAEGLVIEKKHLPSYLHQVVNDKDGASSRFVERKLDDLEQKHICDTLKHLNGNKTKTAHSLGITVKTLYNKLHRYGMVEAKKK